MEGEFNLIGGLVFWLYIWAALFFAGLVLHTAIIRIESNADTFFHLSFLSFAVLSYNMLDVLFQSFNLWHTTLYPLGSTSDPIGRIWRWSFASTLFRDFATALLEDNARYAWSAAALWQTFGVCVYMGIEGRRRQVPRLWAFFCLSQILPVSFTQNLFYLAISGLPKARTSTVSLPKLLIPLTALYCGCLAILPTPTGRSWLIPILLLTRLLLFTPLLLTASPAPEAPEPKTDKPSEGLNAVVLTDAAAAAGVLLLSVTTYSEASEGMFSRPSQWAIFAHPAVRTLGCDFILSLVSLVLYQLKQDSDPKSTEVAQKAS